MPIHDIMQEHHYRIDFPLSNKPIEKRHLEMLEKIDTIQDFLKNDLKIHGHRGLKNLTCYAPYVDGAECLFTVSGEPEWFPDAIQKLKLNQELLKKDKTYCKIFIQKIFVSSFKPTKAKLKAEQDWYNTVASIKTPGAETEILTEKAEEKRRTEETKRIKDLLQEALDVGDGEIGHVYETKDEKAERVRRELKKD